MFYQNLHYFWKRTAINKKATQNKQWKLNDFRLQKCRPKNIKLVILKLYVGYVCLGIILSSIKGAYVSANLIT